ncbi:MAG TPA: hypothetical protein VH257_11225 [Chloroflexota bacterium]|nr:hypothetical protein [Chloroflexota bacterium]
MSTGISFLFGALFGALTLVQALATLSQVSPPDTIHSHRRRPVAVAGRGG